MALIIDLDIDKCSACGACAVACMDQNDIDTQRCEAPFRVVFDLEQKDEKGQYRYTCMATACMHCADAPCVTACPCGCLSKDPATGLTLYDNTRCIGCHSCSMACPFGAPSFGADGKMRKCDGCITRIRHGLEPACVRNCPTNALRCIDEADYKQEHIKRSLKKLAQAIQP